MRGRRGCGAANCLRVVLLLATVVSAGACGDDGEAAQREVDRYDCESFVIPERHDFSACGDPSASSPEELVTCLRGSGHLGRWAIDDAGLPAYDFEVEQRCDPVARAYSPRSTPLRDPIHLVGNGRGLVAMAHASGGVEIYSQDRGHKWINRIDTWDDPADPNFAPQLGGGFNYYTVGADSRVRSTRFEDLPVNRATHMQSRRFGTGYFETVTRDTELTVRRRVFAPDTQARALVAQVSMANTTDRPLHCGLIEFWDVNIHQATLELLTSDLGTAKISERIDRRRRALMQAFTQRATWRAEQRIAVVETAATRLPAGIEQRLDVSLVDFFPEPIYLAVLDDGDPPDAVWLVDHELWQGTERRPPPAAAGPGDAASRTVELDGAGQHAILAVRVPVEIPPHETVTRRFAFGYAPAGTTPEEAVAELRERGAALGEETERSWRRRLVWVAFPGLPNAGVMQREIAWHTYNALAMTTFDEYRGVFLLGQGGAYKYIHGMDGAMGDLALFAEAMVLIEPHIARDTLTYALATQHGPDSATPWRFPYATTGIGDFTDVLIYGQRSDAYYFLPAAIGRYVALTRDRNFLETVVPYWPKSSGERGTVAEHVRRALDYALDNIGIGARGIVAMGTGDYADGITSLATEDATPNGTSSTYNAGMIVYGFPLAADVIEQSDSALADRMRVLAATQSEALLQEAWEGRYFLRGFVDSGNPLAPHVFFLEPQVFPVLAGIIDEDRRDQALDHVVALLETDIGALSNVQIGSGTGVGGPDRPLIGGIWPVANAWLTGAYARRDKNEAWSSLIRNTLAAHAEKYPDLWYGIWTGPDSFNGPDNERPGEADAHFATALTDYPALNAHIHTGPLRALVEIVGVEGTRDGLRITPRVPGERFAVHWPRLHIAGSETLIEGYFVSRSDEPVVMEIALPSGLRERKTVHVTTDEDGFDALTVGDFVRFTLSMIAGVPARWRIE